MRNAAKILILGVGLVGFGACHRQPKPQVDNQEMSIESNVAEGQIPANADIETLPPDESSGTSSRELNAGDDNPDVNDLSNSH